MICGSPELFFILDQAKPIVLAQRQDEFGQLVIADAGLHLAVQGIGRRLAQREAVDLFDGFAEFGQIEQRALDLVGMSA